MTPRDKAALTSGLSVLPLEKQTAFGILLCERMMPGLSKFAADTGFSTTIYRECLDYAWKYLETNNLVDVVDYRLVSEICLRSAPDTEKYTHPLTSSALNCALSLEHLMSFLSDHDVTHILDIVDLAADTVFLFVQRNNSCQPLALDIENAMEHPLMQAEFGREDDDIKFLTSLQGDEPRCLAAALKLRLSETPGLVPLND
jgi:uncharacterized protein YjaG (DUF416 family)